MINPDEIELQIHPVGIKLKLYRAALVGDYEEARRIIDSANLNNILHEGISKFGDTVLHIASIRGHHEFVQQLLQDYPQPVEQLLKNRNEKENTPFCYAATSGSVEMVNVMEHCCSDLRNIAGSSKMKPIIMAALLGHGDVVRCLLNDNNHFQQLDNKDRIDLLISCIDCDLYDVALDILNKDGDLAKTRNGDGKTALYALAQKAPKQSDCSLSDKLRIFGYRKRHEVPSNYKSLLQKLWKVILERFHDHIPGLLSSPEPRLLFVAIEMGNYEFVSTSLYQYPDLLFEVDNKNHRTLFHAAVEHRQEKIFSCICQLDGIYQLLTPYTHPDKKYNILHYAATLPSQEVLNKVSGAALQMQRELLWFKEVEKVVTGEYGRARNREGETPKAMFNRTHKELREQGEKWMRVTANSCMLVATLVLAGIFQAVYTKPNDRNKLLFLLFLISSSISSVTATSAILTFLSILISTYTEQDFLVGLPKKLMAGLLLLSIAIFTMLVAFTATIVIIYHPIWLMVFIVTLALLLCTPFLSGPLGLLLDVCRSTFRSGNHFRPQHKLFTRN